MSKCLQHAYVCRRIRHGVHRDPLHSVVVDTRMLVSSFRARRMRERTPPSCVPVATDGIGNPRPRPQTFSKLVFPMNFSQSCIFLKWLSGASSRGRGFRSHRSRGVAPGRAKPTLATEVPADDSEVGLAAFRGSRPGLRRSCPCPRPREFVEHALVTNRYMMKLAELVLAGAALALKTSSDTLHSTVRSRYSMLSVCSPCALHLALFSCRAVVLSHYVMTLRPWHPWRLGISLWTTCTGNRRLL